MDIINKLLIILIIIAFVLIFSNYLNFFNRFENEISNTYKDLNKVNINEIDNKINKKQDYYGDKVKSIINIGFTLDKNYVLETMLTVASIMATQEKSTKIRFHFGVTNQFTPEKMIQMYKLRNKINNLTEFNFYYLKDSVIKMKNFHPKGEACPGKFELPMLLPDDVERLIIFDAGDLLVLRDLTDLYNYNMSNYWVLGTPEPSIIKFMITKYHKIKYINIGSILLDVKKFKENNIWNNFVCHKNLTLYGQPDQTLFNIIIPDNKINYLPFKFGGYSFFFNDKNYDSFIFYDFGLKDWLNSNLSNSLPYKPLSIIGIILNLYNPIYIHQFNGKWEKGQGLTIYRFLAKYFINLAGIKGDICKRKPGYCK